MDELRRARALLGVEADASLRELHARYRALAKQWHPDRHASDPQGRAEAELQMRRINAAYATVLQSLEVKKERPATVTAQPLAGRRLTPEEIDRLVAAVGTDSVLDEILAYVPKAEPVPAHYLLARAFAMVLVLIAATMLSWTDWSLRAIVGISLLATAGIFGLGLLAWNTVSRKRPQTSPTSGSSRPGPATR
jgi:hypothetical protein